MRHTRTKNGHDKGSQKHALLAVRQVQSLQKRIHH